MEKKPLTLQVRNRGGMVYQGKIENLTSFNDKGEFDVLSHHANFITLVADVMILRLLDGSRKEIKVDNGVMRVFGDKIDVFLGVRQESPTARKIARDK